MTRTVGAVVLAAGASLRLGRPKQLLLLEGEPLVARAARLAGEAGAAPVFAVVGAEQEKVSAALAQVKCIPVANADWAQGMASSIHAGLSAMDAYTPEAAGALILACDQPRLTAAHLRALMDAFAAHNGDAIAASAYAGKMGVPAVFPRAVFGRLRSLSGDKGARALLTDAPCPVVALPFDGGEIDIDLPGDLGELD